MELSNNLNCLIFFLFENKCNFCRINVVVNWRLSNELLHRLRFHGPIKMTLYETAFLLNNLKNSKCSLEKWCKFFKETCLCLKLWLPKSRTFPEKPKQKKWKRICNALAYVFIQHCPPLSGIRQTYLHI